MNLQRVLCKILQPSVSSVLYALQGLSGYGLEAGFGAGARGAVLSRGWHKCLATHVGCVCTCSKNDSGSLLLHAPINSLYGHQKWRYCPKKMLCIGELLLN